MLTRLTQSVFAELRQHRLRQQRKILQVLGRVFLRVMVTELGLEQRQDKKNLNREKAFEHFKCCQEYNIH